MTFLSNTGRIRTCLLVLSIAILPALSMAGPDDATHAKAKIITGTEKPTECISSVHVNTIDGKQVYVQKLGFDLDAGTHSLSGRSTVNTSFCAVVGKGTVNDKVLPIEADFEAGKTYYLGYDHSSASRKDWKLVIWKVEG